MKINTIYLTILFLLLVVSSCTNSSVLPSTALCTKDAVTMEENYIIEKGFFNDETKDNRVISFTHDQMMENLNYLIAEADKRNIDEEELGFRVYLGAKLSSEFLVEDTVKGDMNSIKNTPGTYYTTVFFVATRKSADSDDASDYENVYEIPALNYGGSRRPPKRYESNMICNVHNKRH